MPEAHATETQLRLAELLASLSLAIDLGMGEPMEWVLKACVLGLRLSERLGLSPAERRDVYYVTLLRHIGCTSTAEVEASVLGDELAMGRVVPLLDEADPGVALRYLVEHLGQGQSLFHRAQTLARFLTAGPGIRLEDLAAEHCEIAERVAGQLGLSPTIRQALRQAYERWDGRGLPHKLKGEAIALPARLAYFALDAVFFYLIGGTEMATATLRSRASRFHDPAFADAFLPTAPDLFAQLETASLWDAVLEAEPGPRLWLTETQLDSALFIVADFADMKLPALIGHSRRVAALAARAGEKILPPNEVALVRRAGWVHDVGRVGVSASIWGKPGPLTESEWERVRLHPHYTERVFSRSAALAPLGQLAGLHHERLDGSGYHRRLPAAMLPPAARVLAAADVYCALTEVRPHRSALSPEAAAETLRGEVRANRLDAGAVQAVLDAVGQRGLARREAAMDAERPPADLSPRELEVLRLIARGYTNKQIAQQLVLSPKTVGHHVERLYDKIGVNTRAGATLFAVQNNLLA